MSSVMQTFETKVSNKGFSFIEEKFLKKGYTLKKNDFNHIIYKKNDSDYDYIEMKVESAKIYVIVPVGNFQYETFFNSYYLACEYLEMHI